MFKKIQASLVSSNVSLLLFVHSIILKALFCKGSCGEAYSMASQCSTRPVPIIFCIVQSRSPPSRCSSISRHFHSEHFTRLDSSYFWCLICCPLKSLILCKLDDSTSEIFSEKYSQLIMMSYPLTSNWTVPRKTLWENSMRTMFWLFGRQLFSFKEFLTEYIIIWIQIVEAKTVNMQHNVLSLNIKIWAEWKGKVFMFL